MERQAQICRNMECRQENVPELWILNHPDVFVELQKQYILSGSDVLYAPTFTCNRIKLAEYGLEDKLHEMTQQLVALSRQAVEESGTTRKIYIAGDMTMTGEQLYPMGTLTLEELIDVYKEQVNALIDAGVDLFAVETMMSLQECRGAVLAIKETCGDTIPILVTLTFQDDMRTLFGTNPETAVIVMESMGVDAVGLNCSTGPDKMHEVGAANAPCQQHSACSKAKCRSSETGRRKDDL